ncbi:MAG: hypothetical protein JO258_20200 [Alphaproteobacteria bacterium]|nr:hypothetical protein [Alphaproteobacteria bacterium]
MSDFATLADAFVSRELWQTVALPQRSTAARGPATLRRGAPALSMTTSLS